MAPFVYRGYLARSAPSLQIQAELQGGTQGVVR